MAKRQVTTLQGTPPELIAQLLAARAQDTVSDKQRNRYTSFGCGLLVVAVFGFFFSLALSGAYWPLGILAILLCGVLLVAGIMCLVTSNRLLAGDLDGARLGLVQELIETLAPDLSDKKPLSLTLQHGDCFQFGTATESRTEGSWMTGKVTAASHEDTWLQLSGRFQDGSLFKLSVTQSGKKKSKPKRKYTKIHERSEEEVALVMRVSPEVYPNLGRLEGALHPERLQGHSLLHLKGLQVDGQTLRLRAETGLFVRRVLRYSRPETGQENRITAGKLVSLMAFLFAGLSHCRAGAENAPAPTLGPAPPV